MKACPDCGNGFQRRYARRCDVCTATRQAYLVFGSGQMLAQGEVYKAQKAGLIPRPADCQCADCGDKAAVHDHRDYNFPLQVEQVCRRCNILRGHAIPKKWSFNEFWSYFQQQDAAMNVPFLGLVPEHFEPIRRKYFKESPCA